MHIHIRPTQARLSSTHLLMLARCWPGVVGHLLAKCWPCVVLHCVGLCPLLNEGFLVLYCKCVANSSASCVTIVMYVMRHKRHNSHVRLASKALQ